MNPLLLLAYSIQYFEGERLSVQISKETFKTPLNRVHAPQQPRERGSFIYYCSLEQLKIAQNITLVNSQLLITPLIIITPS
jgi:hypothetical protein